MKDSAYLLRLVHEAMVSMGLDTATIYSQVGVKDKHVNALDARFKHNATHQFWAAAERVTDNAHIGLNVAENLPPYRGQVLEYLFLSSPTFGDGLKRALNYQRLISDVFQSYLDVKDSTASLVIDTPLGKDLSHHYIVCLTYGVWQFFCWITRNQFQLKRMDFMFDAFGYEAEYQRVFGCEIRFNQPNTTMVFDSCALSVESDHAQPELLKLHEQLASEQVAKLEQQDLIHDVQRVLGELLDSQAITLDAVAERLGMTQRYLRSALSQAGTTFNQVVAEYRCMLAKHLLMKTNETIDQIVYLTGFSEPSTFYRAFKRWTGLTPLDYRKQAKVQRKSMAVID
ncbi:AraC family transcriptional regulator [Bermanella marisrubri]|uniref:Putative transcriptional regulator (AraC family) protein n=1 Tax=Bermanella marisrubri TaxID=207949 RepID=Q1N5E6_9GAMM|nr:AraC family transcriptional regulator [Bermanella marisrubri]EAT13173.1 putative transcriptional regulator (AraC family) protein [Oceanobacter sp. RED65] [Bermanella marisrubri]QIZ83945.1 AraC family transcriptional regulator [Bermanella marisrubri]